MRSVAIVQSNYLPWKGYFDLIASVDLFVIYDAVQYTRRDWRNRNRIKTEHGLKWLTVPVRSKGNYDQSVDAMVIRDKDFAAAHRRQLEASYARAPFFGWTMNALAPALDKPVALLSTLNTDLLKCICARIGISTPVVDCRDFELAEDPSERLASIAEQSGADLYVSGPAARAYLDETMFAARGIAVEWFDYADYPEYPQLWRDFVHGVSILDLLFNCGPDAAVYMKHVR